MIYQGALSDADRDSVMSAMNFAVNNPIPEPTTLVLLGLAGTMLLGRRWQQRNVPNVV